MGFLNNIKQNQIKFFTKGACRAMLASFLIFEDQMKKGKIEANLLSDLVVRALSMRSGWKLVEENIFKYRTKKKLKIEKDSSLADVTLSVVLIEMEEFILNDVNPEEILGIITDEFTKFFSAVAEEEIKIIIKRNSEWIRILGAVAMRRMGHKGFK